jgi:hypothetical protein
MSIAVFAFFLEICFCSYFPEFYLDFKNFQNFVITL